MIPCVPPRPGEQVLCFASGAGAYPAALAKYQEIHKARPENVECLRYLLHIYTEMGHKEEVQEYAVKLRKAERAAQEATTRAPQVSEPPLTRRRGGLGVGVGLGTRAVSDGSAARGDRPTSPICTSRHQMCLPQQGGVLTAPALCVLLDREQWLRRRRRDTTRRHRSRPSGRGWRRQRPWSTSRRRTAPPGAPCKQASSAKRTSGEAACWAMICCRACRWPSVS